MLFVTSVMIFMTLFLLWYFHVYHEVSCCCKTVQLTWKSSPYKFIHTQQARLSYYLKINIFEPEVFLNYVQDVRFYPTVELCLQ